MSRISKRTDKTIYQLSREAAGFTRDEAAEELQFISADRIDKLEREVLIPHPDEVLAMEKCYKNATLSNYYCSNECPIGMKYIPELQFKDISQITLEILNSLNTLEKKKNRLIEITVDGKIAQDEEADFDEIQKDLTEIMKAVQTLRIWIEHKKMAE